MTKIIFIIIILLSGCSLNRIEKPFIIINKDCDSDKQYDCLYQYQDANGHFLVFRDKYNKYNIGDTIK